MNVPAEFLSADEIAELTGRKAPNVQCEWLQSHGWAYEKNASGRPVIGRWYARLKLAGIQPAASGFQVAGQPNLAALD